MILADTEKQIFNLLESRASGDFVPIRQVALNVLDKIEGQATRSKSTVTVFRRDLSTWITGCPASSLRI